MIRIEMYDPWVYFGSNRKFNIIYKMIVLLIIYIAAYFGLN